jgi:hypothetical protein
MKTSHALPCLRRLLPGCLLVSLAMLGACASSPPPPAQVVPASETPPPTAPAEPATPPETAAATTEETPPAPECQAPEECVKARGEAAAGTQWMCEAGTCVAQAAPEPPKADEAAQSGKTAKSKKRAKKNDRVGE